MRPGKLLFIGVAVLLVVLIGGGVWWYIAVPHSAEAQYAAAEKMKKELDAEAVSKTGKELQPKMDATIEQYRRVWTRFGKGAKDPADATKPIFQAEAIKKIAEIHEKIEKDDKKALADLQQLEKDYPEEENAGMAMTEEARLIRKDADELKSAGKPEAEARYKEALAKLEDFRKKFEKSKNAGEALMEMGRIWQDGLEEPPIHPIEIFTQVLQDYPHAVFEPEAIYRLAKVYEKTKEYQKALTLYTQLLEEYPKCKWAADATFARGRLLADQMDKHDEAAKEFEKMAQDFPDDPRAGGAAKAEKQKAAEDQGKKYGDERYGGHGPVDTADDKPFPPSEMLKEFIAEKLDAENYDLNVAFEPADHKITINGTLKLTNNGTDKKNLLLMLGSGFNVTKMTVDGAEAQTKHNGQSLLIVLPAELKKDAGTTLGFTYSGQYADADMMKAMMPGPAGGVRGAKPPAPPVPGPGGGEPPPPVAPGAGPAPAPAAVPEQPPALPGAPMAPNPKLTVDPQIGLGQYGYALSGAAWYPITIIGDVFNAHVTMTVPANMEAVSNGAVIRREKSVVEGTPGTFEFQTKNPVFGLYFGYGPYTVQEKQVGAIHYYTYLHKEHAGKHEAYVTVANNILSFYSERFAPFPFEKMAIIEAPLPPFLGGVGPASLMFLQENMVDHPEVPETLLAHELAHQWFGNLIPINLMDPGYNQWLSEGFATYCDALYTEHKDGPKAFALHIEKYQQLYFQLAMSARPKSIRDTVGPADSMYRPIVYEKGALVLHMLRKVMGDDKFFKLMRQFIEVYRNKGTTTDDFRKLASEINGSDLSWFFSEWYDHAVYAHWKVNAEVMPAAGGIGAETSTKVTITQPDELVTMPADITLIGAKDERLVMKDVMLDKKENVIDAKTPFVPVKVVLDEDNWVLKRPGTDNMWVSEKAAIK
ncbi:MAG TPA: M1 family aminopeptidase [Phycisphaerae bacterium]